MYYHKISKLTLINCSTNNVYSENICEEIDAFISTHNYLFYKFQWARCMWNQWWSHVEFQSKSCFRLLHIQNMVSMDVLWGYILMKLLLLRSVYNIILKLFQCTYNSKIFQVIQIHVSFMIKKCVIYRNKYTKCDVFLRKNKQNTWSWISV